ncbi:MAG TPA: WD40 repeat domain-containing protein [Thermoguttaceae bacterium]|nr:WD40 repeat domain-containing protein [Thermoguttaceae bacterium]
MQVLEAGDGVTQLRFLPDGRRLLAAVAFADGQAGIDVWTLPQGDRVRLPLPTPGKWADVNAVAIHPSGESCYVAWDGRLLSFRTADGAPLPVPDVAAHQVVVSPSGDRLVVARFHYGNHDICALETNAESSRVIWHATSTQSVHHLAGFLPDGERLVTVDDSAVRIRAFADNKELAATRFPANSVSHPLLSPDGQHLGVSGYTSMYVYETAQLGKPRRISGSQAFGNFISFAFHPDGRALAVIHGGPTLVKMYDLKTLKVAHKLNWRLGPLQCVTFSPDGSLGAAGSQDGRIVLWDVDP